MRKFLNLYGSEIKEPRQGFIKLVEIYHGSRTDEEYDPGYMLGQLANTFPEPNEAVNLKRDKLATLVAYASSSDIGPCWKTVQFLLRAKEAAAFKEVPFDFGSHAKCFWENKRADVLSLLGKGPQSKRYTDFVQALARVLTPADIPTIWHEQPEALSNILGQQPLLATAPHAWNLPVSGQQFVWERLRAATIDEKVWALICGAMLNMGCNFCERETVELAGGHLVEGLQKWLESDSFNLPSPVWREALSGPLARTVKEENNSAALFALAAWTLPPEQANLLGGRRDDIQALARHGLKEVPRPLVLPTLFWLTAIGLQTSGENGFALLKRAFFLVYEAVALSKYPGDAWDRLAPVLPHLDFWLDWDRCRPLRRALQGWLQENPNFSDAMINAAPSPNYAALVKRLC
ncbi:MAG: hypothetical protein R3B95_20085 [Nitrospirales bacterium]|nr:hypothetical protein [Nitrospirales bacterium]